MTKNKFKFMKLSNLISLNLLTLSFGCFQSADKDKSIILSSPSLKNTSATALSSSFFEIAQQENEQWWEIFNSSELNVLIETAINNSPTLQLAESRIVAAQATVKSVRSKLFPELSMNASENWAHLSKYGFYRDFFPAPPGSRPPAALNDINLSLNFSYEIDFWGKNRKKLAGALGLAIAKQMEKKQIELVLCEAVAFSFFEWQAHTAEKNIYEKWLLSEKKLSHFFSSRYESGLDNTLPPLKQTQQLGAIEQKIIDLEKKREVDVFFLKSLLGMSRDDPLSLTVIEEHLTQKIQLPENLGLDLLAQRPDLMSQIWKVAAAGEAIGVAKTEFYPNVNLAAVAGLSSLTFSHLFLWASRTGALTPAVHLPIFTGWQLEANLDQKVALFNEEVSFYNEMLLKAAQQVAEEITTFISVEKQLQIQNSLVSLQKKSYEISSLRFEKGVDNYKPVITSSQTLFSQEINAVYLNHALILSTLRIIQSLGGGLHSQKLPPSLYP